jgi:hypothetical protein
MPIIQPATIDGMTYCVEFYGGQKLKREAGDQVKYRIIGRTDWEKGIVLSINEKTSQIVIKNA